MSVLQVYLNWANSVLAETGRQVEGISSIQEGQVLCQLIDLLCPEACLLQKLQALGSSQLPEMYIQTALDHMRKYGIKLNFSSQDIIDGDIKSMLDVLWLIILNYGIHSIRRNAHQRSVGIGKKLLLEWCQRQLNTDFDSRNTLTYNLCTGDWFIKLLKKFSDVSDIETEDKVEQLKTVLDSIEKQYSIKSSIINASDIIDGTVDEHTLMIYVSLLQRKIDGNSLVDESSSRSGSRKNPSDETSDWFSTSNGSSSDPQLTRLPEESEKYLAKTISDTVSNQFNEEDKLSALSGSTSYDSRERTLDIENSPHSDQLNGSHEPKRRNKLTSDTIRSSSPLRRPRDHKTIMAEAKEKLEEQRRRREEEDQKIREFEKKLHEKDAQKVDTGVKLDSARSSNEDVEDIVRENLPQYSTHPSQYLPGLGRGVPILVMPGQNPEMAFLLQALRQARHEANFHDQDSSSKSSSEETIPKGSKLLDLEGIDDIPPSEYIRFENEKKAEISTPRGVSPRKTDFVPSPEFLPTKKSVIDVVGNPPEPQTNVVDFPPVENGDHRRHFPRVEIKEDVKVRIEMKRDKSEERESPRREKSPRPLSPGYDYIDDTISINDKETVPKTILKKSSNYGNTSRDSSYDRTRERSQSPRSSDNERTLTRSPREHIERDDSESGDRLSSGRSVSPRSLRSPRHRSPDLNALNENRHVHNRDFSPGQKSDSTDPNRRLVKVFHQDLELLRMKMEMLEKSNIPDDGDLEDLNSLTQRLSEKIKERLSYRSHSPRSPRSHSPRSPRSPRQRSKSPDHTRGRLYRKKGDDLASSESRSLSENRVSSNVSWRNSPNERAHSLHDLPSSIDDSLKVDEDGKLLYSPRSQGKPITLGYSSPIRKVSDEIWGMKEEEFAGVTNVQKEKWKKLTNSRNISDNDVIELKQALGTVLAENDILQAKLRNANTDINEKMKKTGEVLNDCRHHLSKAQAENMELRTQLEKERTRNESLEARMRDLEKDVKNIKATNSELESELEQTRNLLKGSSKKDIPTMQSLSEERDSLVEVLGTTQTENERLREELERAQKYAVKAQSTIGDLKTIVDDARKERQQLFNEITRLQSEGHLQTITGIIKRYMDKGLYLDVEPINGFKLPSRSASPTTKERLSRSVDSAISPRSRSESTGNKTPTKQIEGAGNKSPRSRSESAPRSYQELSRSYQEPSRHTYLEPSHHSYRDTNQRSYRDEPFSRSYQEPVMTSSPLKSSHGRVNGIRIPVTPVVNDIISDDDDDDFEDEGIDGFQYNYEDISPAVTSEFREIYPHRKTRSYRYNFTNSFDEGRISPTVDDIEVNRIFSQNPTRLDFNDTNESYRGRSPRRDDNLRSPRRDDNFNVSFERSKSPGRLEIADLYEMKQPVRQQSYNFYGKNNIKRPVTRSESPDNRYSEQKNFPQKTYNGKAGEINNRLFIAALDSAVQDDSPKKYYDDHDIPENDNWRAKNDRLTASYGPESSRAVLSSARTQNGGMRGILKNTKSEQNFKLKHGMSSPLHRSVLQRSVSPAAHNTETYNKSCKLAKSSVDNGQTLGHSGQHSAASSAKPLFSAASKKSGIIRNPKDLFADVSLSPVRTASPSKYQHTPLDPPPQLTEEEKRYADLLVEKYTKQLGFNTIYS